MHELALHPSSPVTARQLAAALVPLGLAACAGVIVLSADDASTWDSYLRVDREPLILTVPGLGDLASPSVLAVLRTLKQLGYVAHEEGDPEPLPWQRLLPHERAGAGDAAPHDIVDTAPIGPALTSRAMNVNAPATPDELTELAAEVAMRLPSLVVDVLLAANGMQIGDWLFYASTELAERNQTWGVLEDTPGWLALAGDGGGRLLVAHDDDPRLYTADVSSPAQRRRIADEGRDWIAAGAPEPRAATVSAAAPGEVFATQPIRDLVDIQVLRAAFAAEEPLHAFTARVRTHAAPRLGVTSLARARLAAARLPAPLAASLAFRTASGECLSLTERLAGHSSG